MECNTRSSYMKKEKRERGSNFSETDKELLISIISKKYINIIENKRIDSTTIKEKIDTWEAITHDFNARTTNDRRTNTQLKNAYNNIKKKLKKDKAEERIQLYETAGGIRTPENTTKAAVRMFELLQAHLEPLQNKYDSSTDSIIQDADANANDDNKNILFLDATEVANNNSEPGPFRRQCTEDMQTVKIQPKKRIIRDDYDNISSYTQEKRTRVSQTYRKAELELEILELKKQIYAEKLKQEKFNTQMKDLEVTSMKKTLK